MKTAGILGQTIGKWLMQARNGFDASLLGTLNDDLRPMLADENLGMATQEGAAIAQQQQQAPLTPQQQELLQQISSMQTDGAGYGEHGTTRC